jgi:hypothetical protein
MYSDPHNYYQTPVPPVRRSRKRYWPWIFGGCLATMICLACFSIVALSGAVIAGQQILAGIGATQTAVAFVPSPTPTLFPTPAAPTPTEIAGPTIPATTEATTPEADPTLIPTPTETPKPDDVFLLTPPDSIEQRPYQENSFLYLNNLLESDYPVRDYYESATRLTTLELGERTITAGPYSLGAIQTFMTEDGRLEAELMAVTEHAYFWIETSLTLDPATVNAAAERFELE